MQHLHSVANRGKKSNILQSLPYRRIVAYYLKNNNKNEQFLHDFVLHIVVGILSIYVNPLHLTF